jgi:hypothetical protein
MNPSTTLALWSLFSTILLIFIVYVLYRFFSKTKKGAKKPV